MQPIRPALVEAALLYQDYEPFAYEPFVERLRMIFGEDFKVTLGVHEDGSFGLFNINGIYVKLSQNPGPLGPEGFQGALSSTYMGVEQPDAQKIIHEHRKNIFVTVGGDDIIMPDFEPGTFGKEMEAIIADVSPKAETPNITLFSNRVFVARIVVSQLIGMNRPELIHWCQSDQLFKPEQMIPSDDPRGMTVQIHPNLYSSGEVVDGSQKIGFHAYGAEHVMGHHLIVEETPFALPLVIEAVHDLIYSCSKTGDAPESGKVVHMKSGASMLVHRVAADDTHPRPYLRVEVQKLGAPADRPVRQPAAASHAQPDTPVSEKAAKAGLLGGLDLEALKAKFLPILRRFSPLFAAATLYFIIVKFADLGGSIGTSIVSL